MQNIEPEIEDVEYVDEFSEEPMDDLFGNEFDKLVENRLLMAMGIIMGEQGIT
jgi:hypothetical protein